MRLGQRAVRALRVVGTFEVLVCRKEEWSMLKKTIVIIFAVIAFALGAPLATAPVPLFGISQTAEAKNCSRPVGRLKRPIVCPVRCKPKAGFGACVARCTDDGCVCDSGARNCE